MNYFNFVNNNYINSVVLYKNKIKKTIPKKYSEIERYILRIIQFYSGVNVSMPITADWDLKDYCIKNNIPFNYVDKNSIRKEIDDKLFDWCKDNNQLNGAKRWIKALS